MKYPCWGDLKSVSKSVNNWMPHESQHKVHTFLIENADGKIYFASMDYAPSFLVRGSHIYTIDIETDEIADYSRNQSYIMNRDLKAIRNGTIPATNSGVFTEYYAIKGIALHPGTPDILYAMTYARSASGSGWDVEPGNVLRYRLEGDFTGAKIISVAEAVPSHVFPNPFVDRVSFDLGHIPADEHAVLRIFDLYGRLQVEEKLNGERTFTWHGTNNHGMEVPPGMYIYRLEGNTNLAGNILKIK
jgi:hypothetical protein